MLQSKNGILLFLQLLLSDADPGNSQLFERCVKIILTLPTFIFSYQVIFFFQKKNKIKLNESIQQIRIIMKKFVLKFKIYYCQSFKHLHHKHQFNSLKI
mgnify:CR=1 FL=1